MNFNCGCVRVSDNVSCVKFDELRMLQKKNWDVISKALNFEISAHVRIIKPPLNSKQEHVEWFNKP